MYRVFAEVPARSSGARTTAETGEMLRSFDGNLRMRIGGTRWPWGCRGWRVQSKPGVCASGTLVSAGVVTRYPLVPFVFVMTTEEKQHDREKACIQF